MIKKNILVIFFLIGFISGIPTNILASDEIFSTYEEAKEFYLSKPKNDEERTLLKNSYPKIFNTFKKYADAGNAEAIGYLGQLYESGKGTARDFNKAVELYKLAMSKGDNNAKYYLSYFNLVGKGIPKNVARAKRMLDELFADGYMESCINLGQYYLFGLANKKDYEQALFYFRKGIEADIPACYYFLGYMYFLGHGVETDYIKAVQLILESEEKGFILLKPYLAYAYAYGKGVGTDYEKAWKYSAVMHLHFPILSTKFLRGHLVQSGYFSDNFYDKFPPTAYGAYSAAAAFKVYCGYNGMAMLLLSDEDYKYKFGPQFKGKKKDSEKAVEFLKKSAGRECLDAVITLADFYKNGTYVDSNKFLAWYYYSKANRLLFLNDYEGHTDDVYLSPEEYYGRPHIIKWLKKEAAAGNEKAIAVINLLKSRKNIPGNYNWIDVDSY